MSSTQPLTTQMPPRLDCDRCEHPNAPRCRSNRREPCPRITEVQVSLAGIRGDVAQLAGAVSRLMNTVGLDSSSVDAVATELLEDQF